MCNFFNFYLIFCEMTPRPAYNIKYGKFWSVSPGHFIKHKPFISEERNYKYFITYDTYFIILEKSPKTPDFIQKSFRKKPLHILGFQNPEWDL